MKKTFCILAIFLIIGTVPSHGQSPVMVDELQKNPTATLTSFVKNFPYIKYLEQVEFTDFQTLQADRRLLWQEKGDGDLFLYYLGQRFLEIYPVSRYDLAQKLAIGEAYLNPDKGYWNDATDEIYRIIGYYILGQVAKTVENEIKAKHIKANDAVTQHVIRRLEQNRIYFPIEKSKLEKITENISKGNFQYLFNRLGLEMDKVLAPLSNYIHIKGRWIGYFVFLLIAILLIHFNIKKLLILGPVILLVPLSVFALPKNNSSTDPGVPGQTFKSDIKLITTTSFLPAGNPKDPTVHIYTMKEYGQTMGRCIWMQRPHARATYFAYLNINSKFNQLSNNKRLILATAGGYTNSKGQPEGLTVEDGNIVNATIMHDRHGLVIVEKSGGIRILNLKNRTFLLPYGGPKILNPLDNLIAFSELLTWAKQKRATLFQTHLLAFSDSVLIHPTKVNTDLRERRILALVSDPKTKKVHHIIFDITQPHTLPDITNKIFALLKKRNMKVEGLLNLDVGSFNILEVYNPGGNLLIQAPVPVDQATNLIVYYSDL
jgi:hypothetical protein